MIITPYNQHVRLLSSEPFGWFAPPKSTRAWEPTLFMESFHSKPLTTAIVDARTHRSSVQVMETSRYGVAHGGGTPTDGHAVRHARAIYRAIGTARCSEHARTRET